jgi:UDP-glucose 4-epimerase
MILPDLQGQRILITGGLGFIGSNLAHKCVELGAKVTIIDSLDPHSGGNIFNIHDIENSIELIFSDILDFPEISHAITNKDIIFNCAASTSHPFSMREPLIDLDVNGKGVINLLEAAKRYNKGIKFIQIGTSTQLGSLHYTPADELHPEFPNDIYSSNKSVSEKYALIYGKAYNMKVVAVRLSNVFGPRASIMSPEFTFNNYFIGLALQGKDITIFGKGEQIRNLIYINDVVSALILASQSQIAINNVFFVVGDEHLSVAKIAETITKIIGNGRLVFVDWPDDRKVIEIGDAIISNNKAKSIFNWMPEYSFIDGLKKTKEYYDVNLKNYL